MKRLFLILFIFSIRVSFATLSSQTIVNNIPKDTVPFVMDEEEMMDYNDSLISFPAYDLYCGWDTTNIHSIKFDISSLKDSIAELALYDDNSCGYTFNWPVCI